jgi:hypothetical protein
MYQYEVSIYEVKINNEWMYKVTSSTSPKYPQGSIIDVDELERIVENLDIDLHFDEEASRKW